MDEPADFREAQAEGVLSNEKPAVLLDMEAVEQLLAEAEAEADLEEKRFWLEWKDVFRRR
jgi:hypothetical protein